MKRRFPPRWPLLRDPLLLGSLFLTALFPRLYHANAAFTVFADHNTSNWAIFARNLLERGWLESRLGLIINISPGADQTLHYFSHHPPTLALLTSLSFLVLGVGELSSRLAPLAVSAATCPLLFALFRRVLGAPWAVLGALFFALAPGAVIYGQSLNPEAFVVFLGGAAIWAWCRFDETGARGWWRLSLVLLAAAVLTDWPGVYLAPALLAASALSPRTRKHILPLAVQTAATTAAALAIVFAHILVLKSSFEDIMEALRFRVLSSSENVFTLGQYAGRVWEHAGQALTASIRWMAVAGLGLAALRLLLPEPGPPRAPESARPAAVAAALAVSGWLHHLIFTNACYFNPNISYLLVPSLVLLASACPAILAREAALRTGRPAAAAGGAAVALAFLALFALQAPALFHYHFTKFVSPGWPLIGKVVERVVPVRGKLLSSVSTSSPQFRHYAWRRMQGGRRSPQILPRHGEPVYYLRDLNSRLPASLESALDGLPRRHVLNFRIYRLGPGSAMPRLQGLEPPATEWSLSEVRYGDHLLLNLFALGPTRVTAPRPAWWERFLGVPWTLERAAGRIVHASVVWQRLDGAAPSLHPRYWLALEGSGELVHAPLMWPLDRQDSQLAAVPPGGTVRHDVAFFFSEWLPPGDYSLRVGILAGDGLLALTGDTPPDPQLGAYARLGKVRFQHAR